MAKSTLSGKGQITITRPARHRIALKEMDAAIRKGAARTMLT
jgi:hypothetical protein